MPQFATRVPTLDLPHITQYMQIGATYIHPKFARNRAGKVYIF